MEIHARIMSLKVRAARSAELSFAGAGIVESIGPQCTLGAKILTYSPRANLYSRLSEIETDTSGKPTGRLVFGSERIRSELLPRALMVLNSESQATELDEAILARQNEYLSQYCHINEMEQEFKDTYKAKLEKLNLLQGLIDQHYSEIEGAYQKETGSIDDPAHPPTMRPTTIATVKLAAVGTTESGQIQDFDGDGLPGHGIYYTHKINQSARPALLTTRGEWEAYSDSNPIPKLVSQQMTSIVQSDHIAHPRVENHMRHERLGLDILDEILAERSFAKRIPHLSRIWENELKAIDLSVRKLQLAYIDTFLCSPIDGLLTAVYKQAGESTRSTDPVARVEDQTRFILSGQIQCGSAIIVGQKVKVKTTRAFGTHDSPSPELNGKVILTRGLDGDVGKWTVAFDVEANSALPIDYSFEPNPAYTTITIG